MKKQNTQEPVNDVVNSANADQAAPIATLLSSISYTDQEDYEKFLNNLTNEHALIVLISAANHCQAKGIFNLEEAELVAKAIRKISRPQQPQEQGE